VAATYKKDIWIPGIASGFLAALGLFCANYAVSKGLAGPASAIINCCSIIQTLMDYFILNQQLNVMQLLGFLSGLFGAMIFAIGNELGKFFKKIFKRPKSD
jgi:drug/metabolite transporter (DMT)-like permease